MARQKSTPLQRAASDFADARRPSPDADQPYSTALKALNGAAHGPGDPSVRAALAPVTSSGESAGVTQLLICVGGIYASFLSWALLQERITTSSYGPSGQKWTYSVALNTIQSTFAALSGLCYLYFSTPKGQSISSPFPSASILGPLALVALVSSLASPFGYAALGHVDYVTYILAKSCKLLPVMLLHLTVFRRRYPVYKYGVVAAVTAGVAVFTLHHPGTAKKSASSGAQGGESSSWGLLLLGINLLFDGLSNSTQDHIFSTHKGYKGPQMMAAQNILATGLTVGYLTLLPLLPVSVLAGVGVPASAATELQSAVAFLRTYPEALWDVLGFSVCGAIGQVFIFATLARFSSILLVTVTVTRKMLSMVLSVLWFGHALSGMQWLGVGLVFGGVGAEGWIARREKMAKETAKAKGEKKVDEKEL